MAHLHGVVDVDKHFVIDAATREITNQSDKITLMQNDHNSERFTFEIPREVDGHDMSLCNVVRVHYLNVDATTKAQNPGVYEVEDLQISPDNEEVIVGSWLVSANATKNVGGLNFIIRFKCVADDGSIEYAWSSAIFKGISVGQSYNNSGAVAEENADILAQWQARIEALEKDSFSFKIVDALPEADISESTIYLLKMCKNVLSLAEGEGDEVYNNTGYKADTEYSFALAEECEAEGIYLSGFIPVKSDSVIKLSNITMNREADKACRVFLFDEKTYLRFWVNAEQLTESNNAIWDESGNLVAFRMPESSGDCYIRIQAAYIGENSSIVINEQEDNLYAEYIYVNGVWEKLGSGNSASAGIVAGENGKSAFEYAVEGGYSKSEAEFYKDLAGIGNGSNNSTSGTSLQMVEAKVDYTEAVIHTYCANVITFECSLLPENARVRKVEIPDLVNETDEYIALEDMVAKDTEYKQNAPYFVMYPKNMQGDFSTTAACVVFSALTNNFYSLAELGVFADKTIKIYYEIEE